MSDEELRENAERTYRAHQMLIATMAVINDDPEMILPALAHLTGYTLCVVADRHGMLAALDLAAKNMEVGVETFEAAQKSKKRKRGMNKRSAVKAVEDLLKGQKP